MNLQHTSDNILLQQADKLAKQERKCLTALLHHLSEINARRLYSALKYSSLFDYTVKRLKYSEDQAYRRLDAMRLFQELPQIEEKILSGGLTLTNLNLAQALFRREKKAKKKYSKDAKLDVLKILENKSCREAQRVLAKISPAAPRDTVRPISGNEVELCAALSNETLQKLEKLKGLLAHSCPGITFGELIDKLADEGLKAWDKTAAPRVKVRQKAVAHTKVAQSKLSKNPRYIPRQIYRMVWQRDKNCRQCGSGYALQVDHVVPLALGGRSELGNLRLLCRHCNQRAAIEVFGQEKMVTYLNSREVTC